jgi:uncharacterized protein YyaL (SSP411 family)
MTTSTAARPPNRLINEKSPYLLQHAYNPVQWYPWGEEAFAKAREEVKPIFLSIGYSTCHWCHVMERESFESDRIAEILNRHFVPIKVDREERPDVDKVYMTALQAMGQDGGWPLSMFLTPDLKPFYGGTYFPPETKYGRIGVAELLGRIQSVWEKERERILESAEGVARFLADSQKSVADTGDLSDGVMDVCYQHFMQTYDPVHGGFGGAPKFPRPAVFDFLLRHYHTAGDPEGLEMVSHSLRMMARGGMHDHIGGGFHRYSVDREWRVPHFEKMLYDQAQLVGVFLDAYRITRQDEFASVARKTLEYVKRDLTHPDGGFYSAEDADSEIPGSTGQKGEGAFYVWTKAEVDSLLSAGISRVFCRHFGIEEEGNVLHDPHHEFTGKNILYVANSLPETAEAFNMTETEVENLIGHSSAKLFDARSRRPRPHLDDKLLCSWNGLMIGAFARAYQVLEDKNYLEASARAASFVLTRMYNSVDGTLRRRFRDGEAKHEAHLDDYAFLAEGLIELYEASFDVSWLEHAIALTGKQIELFWDGEGGGFFDTTGKDPSILVRMKERYDGAEPAGNSIAAMNLLRLAEFTGRSEWREKAEAAIAAAGAILRKHPSVMPRMVCALDRRMNGGMQIVVAGNDVDPLTQQLLKEVYARYLPDKILILADGSGGFARLSASNQSLKAFPTDAGRAAAYVCEAFVCRQPVSDPGELGRMLTAQAR